MPSGLNALRIALVVGIVVSHSFWALGPLVLGIAAIVGSTLWWWITEGRKGPEPGTIYYDDPIYPVVRFRREWRPTGLMRRFGDSSTPWFPVYNRITGLRLRVSDRTITVRGMGLFLGVGKLLGFDSSLSADETTMVARRLSLGWVAGLRRSECIVLSRQTGSDSSYSVALRPADGNLERLRCALRMAGVQEG